MRSLLLVRWIGAVVAVQAAVATAMTFSQSSPTPASESKVLGVSVAGNNGKGNAVGTEKKTILASGTVTDLFPGAVKSLPVLLQNTNDFDVVVTDIRATAVNASVACSSANVRIDDFNGQRLVPKNGTATQALVARMHSDAPNACKNAQWQLTFAGRAEKPDKS